MKLRNKKHGRTIDSPFQNHQEAVDALLDHAAPGHWLWFWIHESAMELTKSPVNLDLGMENIASVFMLAIGNGLKRPRIRVRYTAPNWTAETYRYKIYLSKRGTVCIKSARLKDGCDNDYDPEVYVGCVWDGIFKCNDRRKPNKTDEAFLEDLGSPDIASKLAEWSRDLGTCCYCSMPLDDPRSKTLGYGPYCAARWGLPWGADIDPDNAPSFFKLLTEENQTLRYLMRDIGADPRDANRWGVARDWLEEHGVETKMDVPKFGVTLPNVWDHLKVA